MKADEKRMTNFDEAETTVNETVDECKVQNVVGAKWKHVAIGGAAGIMMGVAGAVVGTEGAEAAETAETAETGMNAANHTPDATGVPVAASVNDEMSFGEAFAAARAEVGAGGIFEWRGNLYNTYYVQEWEAMTPEEREEFYEDAVHPSAEEQPVDVVDAPETPESPVATDATVVPVATAVNDDMSFNEAFAAARAEVGAGGIFEWHGNTYNTYYAEEWEAMSPAEREGFFAAVAGGNAAPVATVQNVEVVDEGSSDNDVRVIGVYEDNVEGHEVYIGAIEVDGENVMFVDVDHDQVFDIAVADVNGDGCISDEEVVDISDQGICVDDLAARAFIEDPNDLLAANDMPDYVNDADVSMC